ncbi:ran-binding protein m [Anaeramoeba flamelloides]|uniref:Ran-binding protein m n=1 Tax=Anaeramoeba flamelloides TaxID=1746091 RepID=A0AAV7ZC77_9EUKA|nr:ran-binding protein m [Anaeramoeba flamelloides]
MFPFSSYEPIKKQFTTWRVGKTEEEELIGPTKLVPNSPSTKIEIINGLVLFNKSIRENRFETFCTDRPFKSNLPVGYFEVTTVGKMKCNISVGLIELTKSDRQPQKPGQSSHSYGFLPKNGLIVYSSKAQEYCTPNLTSGDVIGVCIDFEQHHIFFTRNGVHLGVAFQKVYGRLYPILGNPTSYEKVTLNLKGPFCFDIDNYIHQQKKKKKQIISRMPLQYGNVNELLKNYLYYHGYQSTLEKFESNSKLSQKRLKEIKKQNVLRKLILNGQILECLEVLKNEYPKLYSDIFKIMNVNKKQPDSSKVQYSASKKRKFDEFNQIIENNNEEKDQNLNDIENENENENNKKKNKKDQEKEKAKEKEKEKNKDSTIESIDKEKEKDKVKEKGKGKEKEKEKDKKKEKEKEQEKEKEPTIESIDKYFTLAIELFSQHFIELIKIGKFSQAIEWGKEYLVPFKLGLKLFPTLKASKLIENTIGLLAYPNPDLAPQKKLLKNERREKLAELLISILIQRTFGFQKCPLKQTLKQLITVKNQIRSKIHLKSGEHFKLQI